MDHWLGSIGVVDDAQAAVDECDIDDGAIRAGCPIAESAGSVGASVLDGLVEDIEPCVWNGIIVGRNGVTGPMNSQDACDAAHAGEGIAFRVVRAGKFAPGLSRATRRPRMHTDTEVWMKVRSIVWTGVLLAVSGAAFAAEPDPATELRDKIAALEAELNAHRAELAAILKAENPETVPVPPAGEPAHAATVEPVETSIDVELEEEPATEAVEPEHYLPAFLRGWKSSVEFGLNGSAGNTDRQSLRFVFKTRRKTEKIETSFNSLLRMTQQESSDAVRQLTLDGRNDWFNQDIKSLRYFAEGKVELDEAKPWDYRVSGFGGIGYEFIKNEKTSLVGRSGFGGSQRIGIDDDEFRAEAFLAANVSHKLTDQQNIKAAVEYLPDTSTWQEYRLNANAAWEVKIDPESDMYLRMGVANRYDSDPGNARPNDLDYFVNIGWSF